MRKLKQLDFSTLTAEDLVDLNVLIDAFKNYVKREFGYDDIEAQIAAEDMENPYNTPYIMQTYMDTVEIAGVSYEARYCHTDFCACGLFHLASAAPFEFYMLFDTSTLSDQTVRSYARAKKKFVL